MTHAFPTRRSSDLQQRLPSDKPSILDNEVKWDHEGDDLIFWGGFFNKPKFFGSTNLDLFFYALDEDDRPSRATRDRKLFTPGVRLFRDPAPEIGRAPV